MAMKICIAQTKPVKGNIEANISNHLKVVNQATEEGAKLILFPELSLTGYEPELADALAINIKDERLDCFQNISDTKDIVICIGAPTRGNDGTSISLIIFQPDQERSLYSKQYLHEDEEPFFAAGAESSGIVQLYGHRIALAICYEISIQEHSQKAAKNAANVYLASVAKTAKGVESAHKTLSEIASQFQMTVAMSNCIGSCDGDIAVGKSAVWNSNGDLIEELDRHERGFSVFNIPKKENILNSL